MVTKNFKNIILAQMLLSGADMLTVSGEVVKGSAYDTMNYICNPSYITANNALTDAKYCYCKLGNGQTIETENDLALESVVSTLSCNTFAISRKNLENSVFGDEEFKYIAVFTNSTMDNIVVSEIGIYYNNAANNPVLLYRKTFDPITFAPGDTRTFTINLL